MRKYKTVNEAADDISAKTKRAATPKTRPKRTPVQIRLDGELVVLDSGKSIWACEGHAKTAFQGHIENYCGSDAIEETKDDKKAADRVLYEYLVESGRVEFVPVKEA